MQNANLDVVIFHILSRRFQRYQKNYRAKTGHMRWPLVKHRFLLFLQITARAEFYRFQQKFSSVFLGILDR